MPTALAPPKIWRGRRLQLFIAHHPEVSAAAIILLVWAAVLWLALQHDEGPGNSTSSMPGMAMTSAAATPTSIAAVTAGLPSWILMSIAMMGPAALGGIRHTGINSLSWRRQRAVAEFALAYLGAWTLAGVSILALLALVPGMTSLFGLALVLAIAAGWQLTSRRRRLLRQCHRSLPLPMWGRAADKSAVHFGLGNGAACVGSCYLLMLVVMLAPGPQLLSTATGTIAITSERWLKRPRRASLIIAIALSGIALVAFFAAVERAAPNK